MATAHTLEGGTVTALACSLVKGAPRATANRESATIAYIAIAELPFSVTIFALEARAPGCALVPVARDVTMARPATHLSLSLSLLGDANAAPTLSLALGDRARGRISLLRFERSADRHVAAASEVYDELCEEPRTRERRLAAEHDAATELDAPVCMFLGTDKIFALFESGGVRAYDPNPKHKPKPNPNPSPNANPKPLRGLLEAVEPRGGGEDDDDDVDLDFPM
uniref:Uncharacterized protein n=2 Tax=Phaeomonas parva TaxID=124430 RepID=A0A7S1U5V2_9STRA|mmetsp:Transcript_30364/g.96898  ORF Transcript_30364/g.96898 Transcript_30364/m.96898 type:complete len:224 (+) Transcript_30364:119-790(+)